MGFLIVASILIANYKDVYMAIYLKIDGLDCYVTEFTHEN